MYKIKTETENNYTLNTINNIDVNTFNLEGMSEEEKRNEEITDLM